MISLIDLQTRIANKQYLSFSAVEEQIKLVVNQQRIQSQQELLQIQQLKIDNQVTLFPTQKSIFTINFLVDEQHKSENFQALCNVSLLKLMLQSERLNENRKIILSELE